MAKNVYGDDQGSPFSWQAGDTSTFANQAQNLANQAGDAGLNTNNIQIQNETAKAEQKAGESGQNVAAGTDAVAQGNTVVPDVAQSDAAPTINPTGTSTSGTQIKPYTITQTSIPTPDISIDNTADFSGSTNYQDPTTAYLAKLFPTGLPQSIQDALSQNINNQNSNSGIVDAYNSYLQNLQSGLNNSANNSQDVLQYQNALQDQGANQLTDLNQIHNNANNDISTQNTSRQKAISDYINSLQTGLKNYQDKTQDLSNIGQLSPAELQAANQNKILADAKTGSEALGALTNNGATTNSRLAALSQQAESAAINKAQGQASAATENAKTGQEIQAEGQKAQADAYKKGGNTIATNQTNTLNKLQQNTTDAQKQLTDTYNTSKTNLNKQEQDYVNKAQDTLRSAKIPEASIQDATNAFANSVKSYIDKGNMNNDQKNNLKTQLESIWRIAVGTNPSDINFSNSIAGSLTPLLVQLGENPLWTPNGSPAPQSSNR